MMNKHYQDFDYSIIKTMKKQYKARLTINGIGKMDKVQLKRLKDWIKKDLIRHVNIFLKTRTKVKKVHSTLV